MFIFWFQPLIKKWVQIYTKIFWCNVVCNAHLQPWTNPIWPKIPKSYCMEMSSRPRTPQLQRHLTPGFFTRQKQSIVKFLFLILVGSGSARSTRAPGAATGFAGGIKDSFGGGIKDSFGGGIYGFTASKQTQTSRRHFTTKTRYFTTWIIFYS